MMNAILQIIAALLPFIVKLFPAAKPVEVKIREKLAQYSEAEKKFKQSGDTSDLGDL